MSRLELMSPKICVHFAEKVERDSRLHRSWPNRRHTQTRVQRMSRLFTLRQSGRSAKLLFQRHLVPRWAMHVAVLSLLVCIHTIVLNYNKDIFAVSLRTWKTNFRYNAVDVRLNEGKDSKNSGVADLWATSNIPRLLRNKQKNKTENKTHTHTHTHTHTDDIRERHNMKLLSFFLSWTNF